MAYSRVHWRAVETEGCGHTTDKPNVPTSRAPSSLSFQCFATPSSKGSSGLGALNNACMLFGARVTTVGACHHSSLVPDEHRADLQGWAPFVFENVEADSAQLVHVGMVDLGDEAHLLHMVMLPACAACWHTHLGCSHWVVLWKKQLKLEHTTLVGAVCGAFYGHIEVAKVVVGWMCLDAWSWVLHQSLDFLCNVSRCATEASGSADCLIPTLRIRRGSCASPIVDKS